MKILTGTDIIEIKRIEESINRNEKFIDKVYTKKEIEYCEAKKVQRFQHYAGRFAGKEAVFKAASELLEDKYELGWQNIQIINNDQNKPVVKFLNIDINNIESIDISISHCKEYAVANVVILIR